MSPKVLVSKHVWPAAIDLLRAHAEVDYRDESESMPTSELCERLAGARALVCQLTDPITPEVMDAEPELAVIANVAVGYDNIDVAAASERGILVTNTPGVLTDTTADFAWALLMATARRVAEADRFLRAGRWGQWEIDLLCGQDVHHQTLGILGMGRIGQAFAARARGFSMRILYNDAVRADEALEAELGLEFAPLETVLEQADFLSLHVPYLPETHHLIGAAELDRMKPTAMLVNTARGSVVDEAALAAALASGSIAGAGLDVFEEEPQVDPGLLELERVVLAPHIASASVATRTRMCTMAAENVIAALASDPPPNLVNPEALERRASGL